MNIRRQYGVLISELIKDLKEAKKEHGDIRVVIVDENEGFVHPIIRSPFCASLVIMDSKDGYYIQL